MLMALLIQQFRAVNIRLDDDAVNTLTSAYSHIIYSPQVDPYTSVAGKDAMEADGQKACVVAATLAERICTGTCIGGRV